MGGVLVGEQDHPWRAVEVVDPVGVQSRRASVQLSAVNVKVCWRGPVQTTPSIKSCEGSGSKQQ